MKNIWYKILDGYVNAAKNQSSEHLPPNVKESINQINVTDQINMADIENDLLPTFSSLVLSYAFKSRIDLDVHMNLELAIHSHYTKIAKWLEMLKVTDVPSIYEVVDFIEAEMASPNRYDFEEYAKNNTSQLAARLGEIAYHIGG